MQERRLRPRITEAVGITVKIQSAPQARNLEGKDLLFNSEDISLEGLQLSVETPVPVGALLEFKIIFNDSPINYWHTGNVVWNDASSKKIGVKFNITENPQYTLWKDAVSKLIAIQA